MDSLGVMLLIGSFLSTCRIDPWLFAGKYPLPYNPTPPWGGTDPPLCRTTNPGKF